LAELSTILAANLPRAVDVAVEYQRDQDSYGRLIVSFADVLSQPTIPEWALTPGPDPHPVANPVLDSAGVGEVVELFDHTNAATSRGFGDRGVG
jgi:hypothetical protein